MLNGGDQESGCDGMVGTTDSCSGSTQHPKVLIRLLRLCSWPFKCELWLAFRVVAAAAAEAASSACNCCHEKSFIYLKQKKT